ncbi:tetratricopeptide repeat protein [Olivibacter sp. SDN3]|uniref:tetratricopeptide repeat protein n=1 Tax=Olivibacter sp. SDN3 TaxID=2764720 RepID=UPI0016512827|nr:tetratricopeptide repeat protein [Olivibacter sp. SDN3]QNL51189.1 tetratricopeptide repeat protein [Olivibacter sp. SDN3]
MFQRVVLLVAVFIFATSNNIQASFDFNMNCQKAYQEALNVRLDIARDYIKKEKQHNPDNKLVYLIENYIDYFHILATDNKAEFDKLKKNKSTRLASLSEADKESPYYLFSQAEINLQWALLRGRYQEYVASAFEIKRAYNMLQENAEKFPDFLPNRIALGMVNAVLGSLPSSAQKALGTLGVHGNTMRGEKMLENLVEQLPLTDYALFYDESVFYLMQVWVNITKKKDAYNHIIAKSQKMNNHSLLKVYVQAYTSFKTGHNDAAITYLTNRPKDPSYTSYPYLDYLLAMAKINKLDLSAINTFQHFVKTSNGASMVKDAYLHMAYVALIKGDKVAYSNYIEKVASEGTSYDERDKQALNEANDGQPNVALLKARLLFDGGYYEKARQILKQENANDYQLKRDKIEYCYRFGRLCHEVGEIQNAIKLYSYAIDFGHDSKYYYAANAAVFVGNLYEQKRQYKQAADYYNRAIAMKNHDYEGSIENKAKEGLNRIAGKY